MGNSWIYYLIAMVMGVIAAGEGAPFLGLLIMLIGTVLVVSELFRNVDYDFDK